MKSALIFFGILGILIYIGKVETYFFNTTYFYPLTVLVFGFYKIWDIAEYINKHID